MRYALVKFRVYLLGEKTFAVYTDHASLRTAIKSPHLSQRMARWLSFFSEYNFVVHYKPGRSNILADALSRRPDYDPRRDLGHRAAGAGADEDDDSDEECATCVATGLHAVEVSASSNLHRLIADAYEADDELAALISYLQSPSDSARESLPRHLLGRVDRYALDGELLVYSIDQFDAPRVVVPNDSDLRARIIHEYHDAPVGGHLGRDKTFAAISRDFFWPHQYKWVRKWVRTCEVCQRVKPSPSSQAPLRPLPVAADSWRSVSMDFIFGLPPDARGNTGVLVFVDRFSKMVHLVPVSVNISAAECAALFIDVVFRLHGLPESIVSDRDTRFVAAFWRRLFELLGTRLMMSTAAHPETDGQTERVNRVLEDVLRSYATSFSSWSEFLPLAEFSLNNAVHSSTGMTPFFVNNARHPRVPAVLAAGMPAAPGGSTLGGGEATAVPSDSSVAAQHIVPAVSDSDSDPDFGARLNAVTRSQARAPDAPDTTGADITRWATRTLIDPGAALDAARSRGNFAPKPAVKPADAAAVSDFVAQRQSVVRFVRDALQDAADRQKAAADRRGRKNKNVFCVGDRVLLSTDGIKDASVTNLGATKLAPRFIGPFKVIKVLGDAYTLDIPTTMRLHPTFYVGRLKAYHPAIIPNDGRERSSSASPSPRVGEAPPQITLAPQRDAPGSASGLQAQRRAGQHAPRGDAPRLQPPPVDPRAPSHPQRRSEPAPTQRSRSARSSSAPRSAALPEFRRDAPPPLVDSTGEEHWIVDRIVGHEDPAPTRSSARSTSTGAAPARRRYRVRWLGFPPSSDTWEPRDQLRRDVPDLVREYDASLPTGSAARGAAQIETAAMVVALNTRTFASTCRAAEVHGRCAPATSIANVHAGEASQPSYEIGCGRENETRRARAALHDHLGHILGLAQAPRGRACAPDRRA